MNDAKRTIISKEKYHEIIKFEKENFVLILFGYEGNTIILNGKEKEPYFIATASRNIIEAVIQNLDPFVSSLCYLLGNNKGVKLNSTDTLYHASKVVLDTVNHVSNINKNIYDGPKVKIDPKTKSYNFHFSDNADVSISMEDMNRLLDGRIFTVGNGTTAELAKCINGILEFGPYIIDLNKYADTDDLNTYMYFQKLLQGTMKLDHMFISEGMLFIRFRNKDNHTGYLRIKLNSAFDMFTNDKTITRKAEILIGRSLVNCAVSININTNNLFRNIYVRIAIDNIGDIGAYIISDKSLYTLFKEAVIDKCTKG